MRSIFHDQLARSFDELGGAKACGRYGKNAVGISLNHERGHVDASQVFAEVFMPRCDARETGGSGGAGRDVPTGLDDLFADTLSQEYVGVVEILKETGEEGIPVSSYRLLYPANTLPSTPSGLSVAFSRYGGTPEIITALLTPLEPYSPM